MKLHKDSHVDHGLTGAQLAHVLLAYEGRDAFFIESFKLPEALGTVPCALFGPIMGDGPIPADLVTSKWRGDRKYPSRVISVFEPVGTWFVRLGSKLVDARRTTSEVTVIAGPHDGHPCVLFTVFGGPSTPREPDDIRLEMAALEEKRRDLNYIDVEDGNAYTKLDEHDKVYAKLKELRKKRDESIAFWAEHALVEI